MISLLKGNALNINSSPITILTGGVGYQVFVPEKYIGSIVENSETILQIVTIVKEDSIELFGFKTIYESKIFKLLTTVSGIGPRTAQLILNHDTNEIAKAISSADIDFFTNIPRIGRKNAQKIIIELKAKFSDNGLFDLNNDKNNDKKIIVDTLINMGFKKDEILFALKNIPENLSQTEILRYALKALGNK